MPTSESILNQRPVDSFNQLPQKETLGTFPIFTDDAPPPTPPITHFHFCVSCQQRRADQKGDCCEICAARGFNTKVDFSRPWGAAEWLMIGAFVFLGVWMLLKAAHVVH